jgi:hypothetical protein
MHYGAWSCIRRAGVALCEGGQAGATGRPAYRVGEPGEPGGERCFSPGQVAVCAAVPPTGGCLLAGRASGPDWRRPGPSVKLAGGLVMFCN